MSETVLSQEAYQRLHAELEDLTTRGRVEIARAIEVARALGDLSENGDYHAAKDSQGKMEARVRQLEALLRTARVVDGPSRGDVVEPGCVVELRFEGDDASERYLVGSIEERREGMDVLSPQSPLGQAILGRRCGETVEYQAGTRPMRVEVVGIGA